MSFFTIKKVRPSSKKSKSYWQKTRFHYKSAPEHIGVDKITILDIKEVTFTMGPTKKFIKETICVGYE